MAGGVESVGLRAQCAQLQSEHVCGGAGAWLDSLLGPTGGPEWKIPSRMTASSQEMLSLQLAGTLTRWLI